MKTFRILSKQAGIKSRASLILWLALLLAFPGMAARAEERPVIQVDFVFEGALFQHLSPENRTVIKSAVETAVCDLAEKRWGFLDWSNDQPPPQPAAKWKITFKLETRRITNDSGGTSIGSIGTLNHSGVLAANEFRFDQTPENETIYPLGRLIPFDNIDALSSDILARLDTQLGILFQSSDVRTYLKNIPIADRVIADAGNSRVVVPVKNSDLRSDVDSILRVSLKDANDHAGWLELKTAAVVPEEGQFKGFVVGRVTELSVAPIEIQTPTWWDEKLSAVIDSATEVRVYMIFYSPSLAGGLATEDGIVSDPEQ